VEHLILWRFVEIRGDKLRLVEHFRTPLLDKEGVGVVGLRAILIAMRNYEIIMS
jgi:hypothetical protein